MKLAEILLAWLVYFALHSLLAASVTKAWITRYWPQFAPGYRIAFNVLAVLTLLPILWQLVESYGETYRSYMAAVPGLIPRPWQYLRAKEAAALENRRR
jgi:protein-S-isoprenylcysteine O-methyltransferase Ste14